MSEDAPKQASKKRRIIRGAARRRKLLPRAQEERPSEPPPSPPPAPKPASAKKKTGAPKRVTAFKPAPAPVEDADADAKPSATTDAGPKEAAPQSRRASAIAIAIAVALGGGGIYLATRASDAGPTAEAPSTQKKSLLDAVPSGAILVVTADVRALRASPLAAPYLGGTRSVPGFDDVRQACGFDLIASVDELAVAVPDGEDAEFGVVAIGGFSDSAILDCATKVVQSRGGSPVTSTIGSFKSVRDGAAQTSSGETATRPGGILLWGGTAYLRAMIDAADGSVPSVRTGTLHEKVRSELATYETAQASFVLSDRQRAVVAEELANAQGKAPAALAYVTAAGLGVRLVGDKASLQLVVMADEASHTPEVEAWLRSTLAGAAKGLPAKLLGADDLIERITIEANGGVIRARLEATVPEIEGLVDRAIQIQRMLQKEAPPPSPSPSIEPPAPPPPDASVAPSAAPPPSASVPTPPTGEGAPPPPKKKKKKPAPPEGVPPAPPIEPSP